MGGTNDRGYPRVDRSPAIMAERRRVRALLDQDRADRAAEAFRREAEQRFENGDSASSADAVVPPTREWLAKGDVESYLPMQDKNSTRLVKTVKRHPVPQARKMMLVGVIDYQGLQACIWYSEIYENTGLSGQIPSIDYGREVFSAPHSRSVFSDQQLEAQDTFRVVQRGIKTRRLILLDAMVLLGQPYSTAARTARIRPSNAKPVFGQAVDDLIAIRSAMGA